ncbi:hypothetical protein QVL82_17585, partial [Cellulosimicrobium funkei]
MTPTPQPVTVALVGAGNRGQTYARWIAEHPERARLVAVADPRAHLPQSHKHNRRCPPIPGSEDHGGRRFIKNGGGGGGGG